MVQNLTVEFFILLKFWLSAQIMYNFQIFNKTINNFIYVEMVKVLW